MNEWKSFLENRGAQWEGDSVARFKTHPSPDLDPARPPLLADLGHQRLLSIAGPDARRFLQGQLTCDVGAIDRNHSVLGAHCNPKGRMISSFRIAALADDDLALRLHAGILEVAQRALGKYIVFSKAEFRDRRDSVRLLGIAGTGAESLLANHFGVAPRQVGEVAHCDQDVIIKTREGRFECWLSAASAEPAWAALAPACQLAGAPHWDLGDIREGLGQVRPGTVEMFIPQMLNYDALGAVSFNKGCYTGQEVIARMHYLGKLKRRLYRVSTPAGAAGLPEPGAEVYTAVAPQSVGNVVMSATAGEGVFEALVVATTAAAENGGLFLDPDGRQKLDLLPLPYAIPREDDVFDKSGNT